MTDDQVQSMLREIAQLRGELSEALAKNKANFDAVRSLSEQLGMAQADVTMLREGLRRILRTSLNSKLPTVMELMEITDEVLHANDPKESVKE